MNKPKLKSQFLAEIFPDISEKSARRWLSNEINGNPQLASQLATAGYTKNTKLLTINMQQIIRQFLKI